MVPRPPLPGALRRFVQRLDEQHPGFLDGADWAAWDVFGSLVLARGGGIERYSVQGLASGRADFSRSLKELTALEVETSEQ